ncbi:MAG: redoxin domain-containing protein [Flavobacterium sp.]|jgi:peroxiredoxin|uniref:peroxiredoxin family protein n=1 Tax=Flavobacterium sp. TaxID=239 RepID=UPI0022C73E7C|nr:redoxin domain-containing protein [Flavobacterium sp.]MCZ8332106.1 redoxin domain-containing protein [Flavobacterium sp.]
MKKFLKIFLPILFISIFCYFGYQIFSKIQHKKEVAENIKILPKFEYQNINGGYFTNANLKVNTSKLFIYYNSECDFCNEEAKMIKENKDKFDTTQIIFISFEAIEKIKQFATTHQLDSYDNINFLCDSKITFATTFDVKSMPCIVLYDKNNNLIEKIKGQTKAETLIKKLGITN